MKSSLMVAVLLLGGCMHGGASEPHKQQIDMGRQISEEVFNQGTDAGSQMARDLLVVHASVQNLIGTPEEKLDYTSENVATTAKKMAEEAKRSSFWGSILSNIYSMATTAVSGIPGMALAIPFIGILGEWFRRRHKTIKRTAKGMVEVVNQIKDASKTKKITPELINSIAKSFQDGMGIRGEVRSILKSFKKAIDKGKKKEAIKAIKSGGK